MGISFEKAPAENKTASAGWYNNLAFEAAAKAAGVYARTLDGDAFSDAMREQAADVIRQDMGQIDLVVYSLARQCASILVLANCTALALSRCVRC